MTRFKKLQFFRFLSEDLFLTIRVETIRPSCQHRSLNRSVCKMTLRIHFLPGCSFANGASSRFIHLCPKVYNLSAIFGNFRQTSAIFVNLREHYVSKKVPFLPMTLFGKRRQSSAIFGNIMFRRKCLSYL